MEMPSRDLELFRRNLRTLSRRRQQDVADDAGVSRPYLNRVVNGHVNPSIDVASALAGAVGVSLAVMMSTEINEKSPAA